MKEQWINDNGAYRRMTPEELRESQQRAQQARQLPPDPAQENKRTIEDLTLMMAELLGGGTI